MGSREPANSGRRPTLTGTLTRQSTRENTATKDKVEVLTAWKTDSFVCSGGDGSLGLEHAG